MKGKGIVLTGEDETIEAQARQHKVAVKVDPEMGLAYGKTLFVAPGTTVPWDLLNAAWHFLERWDAAVPLWRYGVNACDVGSKAEQKRTQEIVRDLRVLLHAVELLFVKDNEDGRALLEAYREELGAIHELPLPGGARLAFLRALYRVKPRCCVLPRAWLAEVRQGVTLPRRSSRRGGSRRRRVAKPAEPLIEIELEPGRFVRCKAEDEEKVRARHALKRRGVAKNKMMTPSEDK